MDLNTMHPDYTATSAARTMGRDLYLGQDAITAKGETYLFKGTNETDADFAFRLKIAVLDPYVENIITIRQAVLFKKAHSRKLTGADETFLANCDFKGTDARTFFEQVAGNAQIDGLRWVGIDSPPLPEGGFVSLADEKQSGHRPFFESIPAESVIDWEVGPDRQLLWAVIKLSSTPAREKAGETAKAKTQWKVWTRTDWVLWEPKGNDPKDVIQVASGPNPIGMVPLVPFFGIPNSDYSGWPVAMSVFRHVIAIYNKSSDADWFERLCAHPIPVLISPEKIELLNASSGVWLSSASGGQCSALYLEPTGASFGITKETVKTLESRIFSLALTQAMKGTGQVQSADSKREDRKYFIASLAATSRRNEASERRCWEMLLAWAGGNGKAEINYNADFEDAQVEADFVSALASLVDGEILTRKTALTTLVQREFVDVPDVDAELKAAADEAVAKREAAAQSAVASLGMSATAPGAA